MAKYEDVSGQKFGRLLVLRRAEAGETNTKSTKVYLLCRCECGNERVVRKSSLTCGDTASCGCYISPAQVKHGQSNTPTWRSWRSMRMRCKNPKYENYHNYGGRGITICSDWDDFACFLKDMGERPSLNHSLDRVDVNGNYCKGNCHWATEKQQSRNQRSNRVLTANGITKLLCEWSEDSGIEADTISKRIDELNWPVEIAVMKPARPKSRKAT